MARTLPLVLGALALVLVMDASAEAQRSAAARWRSSPTRVSAYFAMGGCCDGQVDDKDEGFADLGYEFDLDPTLGFGLRAEKRLMDYLALGGMFEFLAFKADGDPDRGFMIDADIFAKILFEVELSGHMGLEIYALLPFGFSAGFADGNTVFLTDDDVSGFGINMGLLGGAMLVFEKFGIFAEFGFRHHSIWDEVEGRDWRVGITQVAFNLGGSVVF